MNRLPADWPVVRSVPTPCLLALSVAAVAFGVSVTARALYDLAHFSVTTEDRHDRL